ncbi:MAG TPA: ketoisovalerate oxidoreductase, partial [Cyanobacteria bacterium UBA9971]|nr:ketoisovalerate oxidoreductase [Cyanobacteria bacterium UBA9971]
GVSIAFCQIADEEIGEPRFSKGDIVIMLSDRAIDRCSTYVDENTTVIYDSSICNTKPEMKAKEIIALPANKIAHDELSSRVFNIIILGAVIKATDVIELKYVKEAMELALGKKFAVKPELRELNHKALEKGMELIQAKAAV